MLTPYRQKYNPKKPKTKIRHLKSVVQVFFKKNFSKYKNSGKTLRFLQKPTVLVKKSPSPFINGEGRHQNTLHFKPSILSAEANFSLYEAKVTSFFSKTIFCRANLIF